MRALWVVGAVVVVVALAVSGLISARGAAPVADAVDDEEVPSEAVEVNAVVEGAFDAGESIQLEFRDLRGDLTIKTGQPGKVLVTAIKYAVGADDEEARRALESVSVEMQPSPGKLLLATRIDTGRWPFTKSPAGRRVDYLLVVQEGSGATVTNAVGNVRITGLKDGVTVTGRKADVTLTNINGGVVVRVDAGRIRIDGGGGGLDLSTGQGVIVAEKLGGETLTVSGNENISLQDGAIAGDVTVHSRSGDIKILRVRGKNISTQVDQGATEVEETTAEGSMTATAREGGLYFTRANAGTLKAATDSGKIEVSETQGAMDLSTKNGAISLWRATPRSLRVEATGDVFFSGLFSPQGEHAIQTSAGDISVYVSKESSLKLDASSTGGVSVDPDIPTSGEHTAKTRLQGIFNDGLAPLSLITKQGSIKILTGEPRFFPR